MLSDPFVGRQDVMRLSSATLEEAITGNGRVALLAGEPLMGKTRTAQRFAANAEQRVLIIDDLPPGQAVVWPACE